MNINRSQLKEAIRDVVREVIEEAPEPKRRSGKSQAGDGPPNWAGDDYGSSWHGGSREKDYSYFIDALKNIDKKLFQRDGDIVNSETGEVVWEKTDKSGNKKNYGSSDLKTVLNYVKRKHNVKVPTWLKEGVNEGMMDGEPPRKGEKMNVRGDSYKVVKVQDGKVYAKSVRGREMMSWPLKNVAEIGDGLWGLQKDGRFV